MAGRAPRKHTKDGASRPARVVKSALSEKKALPVTPRSLQAGQPGCVTKVSVPQKTGPPAWYRRVSDLVLIRELEGSTGDATHFGPYPEDFNDDISELNCDCESASQGCDGDECSCKLTINDWQTDNAESMAMYSEFKSLRLDRKRALADQAKAAKQEEEKIAPGDRKSDELQKYLDDLVSHQQTREQVVAEARSTGEAKHKTILHVQNCKPVPIHNTRRFKAHVLDPKRNTTRFYLFSSEWVRTWTKSYAGDRTGAPFIEFTSIDAKALRSRTQLSTYRFAGHISFDSETSATLDVFEGPVFPGSSIDIGITGTPEHITVHFINNDMLETSLPRSILVETVNSRDAPEHLRFVGVRKTFEPKKRRELRKAKQAALESENMDAVEKDGQSEVSPDDTLGEWTCLIDFWSRDAPWTTAQPPRNSQRRKKPH